MRRAIVFIAGLALTGAASCADSCQAGEVSRPPASTQPAPGEVARGATEPAAESTAAAAAADTTEPSVVVEPNQDRVGGEPIGIAPADELVGDPSIVTEPNEDRIGGTPGIARVPERTTPPVFIPRQDLAGPEPEVSQTRGQRVVNPTALLLLPGTTSRSSVRVVPVTPDNLTGDRRANYFIIESDGREVAIPQASVEGTP